MPINIHETTLYAKINGKYERIGTLDIESEIELHPEENIYVGDIEIKSLNRGTSAEISLSMVSTRELYRSVYPPMATNNWRKMHGLPMWRK